jgi:hypothetical protein
MASAARFTLAVSVTSTSTATIVPLPRTRSSASVASSSAPRAPIATDAPCRASWMRGLPIPLDPPTM